MVTSDLKRSQKLPPKKKKTAQNKMTEENFERKSNAEVSEMESRSSKPLIPLKLKSSKIEAVHPWRLCPYGEHWVKTHEMHVPPSKTHPEGAVTIRHEHCAKNRVHFY